jgi:hypothetical protein
MKLKVKAAFKWAHQGVRVEEFQPGQVIETEDQDLIDVSQHEGWTVRPRNRTKADGSEAPEGTDGADGIDGTDGTESTDDTAAATDTAQP